MPQKPGCEINPVGRPREENILTSANDLTKNIKRVIFTEEEIKAKIAEAGRELSEKYAGKPLLLVSILNGAFVFMADFCRAVTIPCEIAFMCASFFLPTNWQGFATLLARLCHRVGKTLP